MDVWGNIPVEKWALRSMAVFDCGHNVELSPLTHGYSRPHTSIATYANCFMRLFLHVLIALYQLKSFVQGDILLVLKIEIYPFFVVP